MLDTETWDHECRSILNDSLDDDRVLDGLTLMFFGAHYSTERGVVDRICSYEAYIERVRKRLESSEMHESVAIALRKALDGGW
jgi:hypothetical protein